MGGDKITLVHALVKRDELRPCVLDLLDISYDSEGIDGPSLNMLSNAEGIEIGACDFS